MRDAPHPLQTRSQQRLGTCRPLTAEPNTAEMPVNKSTRQQDSTKTIASQDLQVKL